MTVMWSICKSCHEVIIKRDFSSVWKIPINKKKEEHIHEPYDFWCMFGFDARKIRKKALSKYWEIESKKKIKSGKKIWESAITQVIKELKNEKT